MDQDFIYSLSYNQILFYSEPERSHLLKAFNEMVSKVDENVFSYDKTLGDMLLEDSFIFENDNDISDYVFPGKRVIY